MTNFVKFLAVLLVCAVTTSANAEDYKLGNLVIKKPEIPATIKSAHVSAGYLMIKNMGEEADTLVEAYADFAEECIEKGYKAYKTCRYWSFT